MMHCTRPFGAKAGLRLQAAWWLLFLCGCASVPAPSSEALFLDFLDRADAAQRELQQGRPEPYKALWSHRDDVTLAGGFGGNIEKGWERVSQRLDWAGSMFRDGQNEIQRIVVSWSGGLGYVVQTEHVKFTTPQQQPAQLRYRVTMLYRKEDGAWRIVHRHADQQNMRAPPR